MSRAGRPSGIGRVLALGAALLGTAEGADEPRRDLPAAPPGAAAYATHCAVCHGEQGRGDGPLIPLLVTPIPDLTTLSRRNGGRFPANRVRQAIDGRRPVKAHGPMPAWGEAFGEPGDGNGARAREERITDLVSFLASLQQPDIGAPGAPAALCVFANPAYAGRCTETAELPEGLSPREACKAILSCLDDAACVKTYCGATTVRRGWTLESATRIVRTSDGNGRR
jgi:mono/diheme cytochrome c family protein